MFKVFIGDTPMKLTPTLGAGSCYTPVQLMPAGTQECPLGTAKVSVHIMANDLIWAMVKLLCLERLEQMLPFSICC